MDFAENTRDENAFEDLCQVEFGPVQGSSFNDCVIAGTVFFGGYRYSSTKIEFEVKVKSSEIKIDLENCNIKERGFNYVRDNEVEYSKSEQKSIENNKSASISADASLGREGLLGKIGGSLTGSRKEIESKKENFNSNIKKRRVSVQSGNRWLIQALDEEYLHGCYFSDEKLFSISPKDINEDYAFSISVYAFKNMLEINLIGVDGKSIRAPSLSSNKDKCFKMLAMKGLRGTVGDKVIMSTISSRIKKSEQKK